MAPTAEARMRYARLSKEKDLRRAFEVLDKKGDNKLDPDELMDVLKGMGEKFKRSEVDDMIWECDEDCDGCLTWQEFQQMHERCDADTSDFEPRQLFNLTQFIMTDKESRGIMTLEEAMEILYLRYGREHLDQQLTSLFGTSNLNSGKVLTLRDFLHALNTHQVEQLRNSKVSAKSYKAPPPAGKAAKQ